VPSPGSRTSRPLLAHGESETKGRGSNRTTALGLNQAKTTAVRSVATGSPRRLLPCYRPALSPRSVASARLLPHLTSPHRWEREEQTTALGLHPR
jgi:hypothetical protein